MKNSIIFILTLLLSFKMNAQKTDFYPALQKNIEEITKEFNQIPAERKSDLKLLADYIEIKKGYGEEILLTFICTHNSRRSHMSQIWAATAAAFYGLENIKTFSGGTEATAFNARAVKAIKEIGFTVENPGGENPHYKVTFAENSKPMECFSKKYNDPFNPERNFFAIMTCSHADETCPIVRGADDRVSLPYDDPKAFDGTPQEAEKYEERCKQIAREIFYAFSLVK
jgi:arsenate reductase (thioredoxin)